MALKDQLNRLDNIIARASVARNCIVLLQRMEDDGGGAKSILLNEADADSSVQLTLAQVQEVKTRAWDAIDDVKTKAANLPSRT